MIVGASCGLDASAVLVGAISLSMSLQRITKTELEKRQRPDGYCRAMYMRSSASSSWISSPLTSTVTL
jgi:hypothetical protein